MGCGERIFTTATEIEATGFIVPGVVERIGLSPAPVVPSPAPRFEGFFLDDLVCEEKKHFLEACALCNKPLGSNRDIFMYRGDTPFCSEECRQVRIDMDEAAEKARKLSFKQASASSTIIEEKNTTSSEGPTIGVRTGAVVAG